MSIKERIAVLKKEKNTVNVFVNIISAFVIRGGSMFVALFTTSAYITYFSDDTALGLWFTLLSLLAWILNFDMGIGNGVRNKLVKTLADNDTDESKRYISSSYLFLSALAVIIFILGFGLIKLVPWNSLLGVSETAITQDVMRKTVSIVFGSVILQFVLRLITSISYAMQHSFMAGLMSLCTNVILLAYVSVSNYLGTNGSIIRLAVVYLLAVNVPLLAVTLFFFLTKLKAMRPNIKYFSMQHAKDTLKLGGTFLYLQLVAMLLNSSANFLISNLLGSEQVVEYQLYYKLSHFVCTVVAIAITPMWSAITKALVEKRYKWLSRAIMFMFALVGVVVLIEFAMVPMLPLLFDIWLQENAREVSFSTGIVFAIFGSMFTWMQICSYISNGLNKLKIQTITLTIGLIISFSFAFIFAKIWDSYIAVTVGTILGYIPFCIVQTIWTFKFCRKLKSGNIE